MKRLPEFTTFWFQVWNAFFVKCESAIITGNSQFTTLYLSTTYDTLAVSNLKSGQCYIVGNFIYGITFSFYFLLQEWINEEFSEVFCRRHKTCFFTIKQGATMTMQTCLSLVDLK